MIAAPPVPTPLAAFALGAVGACALLTGNRTVMGDAVHSRLLGSFGWAAFVVMVVAVLGLFFAG